MLIEQSLDPMIAGYFKNIGQTKTLIELVQDRSEIQQQASDEMKGKFKLYDLELTKTMRASKKKGSLLQVLDYTSTPMGARMLRKFIEQPLTNREKIEYRLNITEAIKNNFILREELKDRLSSIFDLERICAKIAYDRVSPKDLINLKNSIKMIKPVLETVRNSNSYSMSIFLPKRCSPS